MILNEGHLLVTQDSTRPEQLEQERTSCTPSRKTAREMAKEVVRRALTNAAKKRLAERTTRASPLYNNFDK